MWLLRALWAVGLSFDSQVADCHWWGRWRSSSSSSGSWSAAPLRAVTQFNNHCISRIQVSGNGWGIESWVVIVIMSPVPEVTWCTAILWWEGLKRWGSLGMKVARFVLSLSRGLSHQTASCKDIPTGSLQAGSNAKNLFYGAHVLLGTHI